LARIGLGRSWYSSQSYVFDMHTVCQTKRAEARSRQRPEPTLSCGFRRRIGRFRAIAARLSQLGLFTSNLLWIFPCLSGWVRGRAMTDITTHMLAAAKKRRAQLETHLRELD